MSESEGNDRPWAHGPFDRPGPVSEPPLPVGQWWTPNEGWSPPPWPRRRRRSPALLAALLVVVAALSGVAVGHGAWPAPATRYVLPPAGPGSGPFGGNAGGAAPLPGAGGPADADRVAARVAPALVDINDNFGYQQAAGAGTGIVLRSDGVVVTNNHVVDGATRIRVTDIGNGRTYSADVVGYDAQADVAVLKLQAASGLSVARFSTRPVKLGQPVVAVGNAGGAGGAPSSAGGSVTALNRSITAGDELDGTSEELSGLIEVNAAVQSGDSGGPLVDTSGRVVAMDTAATQRFSFQAPGGDGYAIPVSQALAVARRILSGQASATVHIGPTAFIGLLVSAQGPPDSGGAPGPAGAYVSGVVPGGPAQRAGLGPGDTVVSLDGQKVATAAGLTRLLVPHHPGDTILLGWLDGTGSLHQTRVTLAPGPPA